VVDRGTLRIGDTLSEKGNFSFQGIPRFPPEMFARVYPADPLRRKQLDSGLRELSEEGAAQVFYAEGEAGPAPIVGAVGQLQFDVMRFRLEHEYNAPCKLEPVSFRYPRWVTGPTEAIEQVARLRGRLRLYDAKGHPVMLFEDPYALRATMDHEKSLVFHEIAP